MGPQGFKQALDLGARKISGCAPELNRDRAGGLLVVHGLCCLSCGGRFAAGDVVAASRNVKHKSGQARKIPAGAGPLLGGIMAQNVISPPAGPPGSAQSGLS
jgi:hypothetical protein